MRMFVIVDGIDGSGKGTIVQEIAEHERAKGRRVFDLREYAKRTRALPEPEELSDVDVLVSCEPSYGWVGMAIRDEIVRTRAGQYAARVQAEAFALDRLILYQRVLLPFLYRSRGARLIIQERGFTSSLVYQTLSGELQTDDVLACTGNRLALAHPPDAVILADVDPDRAIERLTRRVEKRDGAVFEQRAILAELAERYRSAWFRDLLEHRGGRLIVLDANGTIEEGRRRAIAIWEQLLTAIPVVSTGQPAVRSG